MPNLSQVNNAYLMKQVWHIFENKESLRVKWVHTVILKGKSLWEIQPKAQDAWLWKRLLWIRDYYEQFILRIIGNGKATSFWFDPWHPWGRLLKNFPELKLKLNLPLDAKVSDVIFSGQWKILFGRGWDSQVISFNAVCRDITIGDREDYWKWSPLSFLASPVPPRQTRLTMGKSRGFVSLE